MKKLLSLAAALLCTSFSFGQPVMKVIPEPQRFHYMTENGKYMFTISQGLIGIYDTETDKYKELQPIIAGVNGDRDISNNLGLGNSATNDGFMVGNYDNKPAIYDIENGTEWTMLGLKDADHGYATANAITPSRKYITGYTMTGAGMNDGLMTKPLLWTLKDDGTYGDGEDLPYPKKDFTGVPPLYILPNCISDDGTVISGQIVLFDNGCLPIVWRKAQDGTWTYEVYDKNLCAPGTVFPEIPKYTAVEPNIYDYMTEEGIAAYKQDSTAYEDSVLAAEAGLSDWPIYWPDPVNYMGDQRDEYDAAWNKYADEDAAWGDALQAYRDVFYKEVTLDFYPQNELWMSGNGKYYATTSYYEYVTGNSVLFTIGDTLAREKFEDGLYGVCVTNDGDLFVSDDNTAYVYPAGSKDKVSLPDWLRSKGETEAADWLEKNVSTGTAICSGDGRVISGYAPSASGFESWIIKLDGNTTGITDATANKGGNRVKVYDLQGRFIKEGEASDAKAGLKKGIYVIDNRKVVVK